MFAHRAHRDYAATSTAVGRRQKGASFASGMPLKAIQADCTRTGRALTSGASDALKTGSADDEAKPLPAICLRQWRPKGQTTVKTSVKC